jgi:glycosyltransferase involved in cell wall biosynthesis
MNTAVIIPLFNGERFIRLTLESVLSQSQPSVDVIVVDDHSQDESVAIVKEIPGVTLLINPEKGAEQARVFGLSQTNAEAIAFLDQDDLWHSDHLKILTDILEKHPECPMAVSSIKTFKSEGKYHFDVPVLEVEEVDPWSSFPNSVGIYTYGSMLFRRSTIESIGGWPTISPGNNDDYLPLRCSVSQPLLRNKGATVAWRKFGQSTWEPFRGLNNYKSYKAGLEEAVFHRVKVKPQDEALLKSRLQALSAIEGIMISVTELDSLLLKKSANFFEESVNNESIAFVETMLHILFFHLKPFFFGKSEKKRGGGPVFLLKHWPDNATKTLAACQSWLSRWG